MVDIETYRFVIFTMALVMNTSLMLISFWGIVSFFPRKLLRGDNAAAWLILAIWLGFVGVFLNVIYWRVFGDITQYLGIFTYDQLASWGRYGDFLWKGLTLISIYLHFYARWKAIPEEDQTAWSPLLMGFYPDVSHWIVKMTKALQTNLSIKKWKDR